MQTVVLLDSIYIAGIAYKVGDVVDVTDEDARLVILGGHAIRATADAIAAARNPRPAAEVREGIATAVPGGKRPGRKR